MAVVSLTVAAKSKLYILRIPLELLVVSSEICAVALFLWLKSPSQQLLAMVTISQIHVLQSKWVPQKDAFPTILPCKGKDEV